LGLTPIRLREEEPRNQITGISTGRQGTRALGELENIWGSPWDFRKKAPRKKDPYTWEKPRTPLEKPPAHGKPAITREKGL